MPRVTVQAAALLTLGPDTRLHLDAAQRARLADRQLTREPAYAEDGKHGYVVLLRPVHFKAGELVTFEGEPPKALRPVLVSAEGGEPMTFEVRGGKAVPTGGLAKPPPEGPMPLDEAQSLTNAQLQALGARGANKAELIQSLQEQGLVLKPIAA